MNPPSKIADSLHRCRRLLRKTIGAASREIAGRSYGLLTRIQRLPEDRKTSVHMLVGRHRLWDAIIAYASFSLFVGKRLPLFLHDDGTLESSSLRRLHQWVGNASVIPSQCETPLVNLWLEGRPACQWFRKNFLFFRKYFDPFFWAPSERFLILDSDIVFFTPPKEVIHWLETVSPEILFNREHGDVWAFPRQDMPLISPIPFNPRINAGFALIWKDLLDLPFAESVLANCRNHLHLARKPALIEQTLWALTAGNSSRPLHLLPETYEISNQIWKKTNSTMRHYTNFTKQDILFVEALLALPQILRHRRPARREE